MVMLRPGGEVWKIAQEVIPGLKKEEESAPQDRSPYTAYTRKITQVNENITKPLKNASTKRGGPPLSRWQTQKVGY